MQYYYAFNPLHNCYDRAFSPDDFQGPQQGISPRTGKVEEFFYEEIFDYDPDIEDYSPAPVITDKS